MPSSWRKQKSRSPLQKPCCRLLRPVAASSLSCRPWIIVCIVGLKSVEVVHTRVHRGSKRNCLGNIHGVSDDRSIVDNQRGRKPNCRIRGKRTDSVHPNVSSATWVSGSSVLALRGEVLRTQFLEGSRVGGPAQNLPILSGSQRFLLHFRNVAR